MDSLFQHRLLFLLVFVVLAYGSGTIACSALVGVTSDYLNVTNHVSNQSMLDQFLDNLVSQRQNSRPRCIQLSLASGNYQLNIAKFVERVDLKENDRLIVRGKGDVVNIHCLIKNDSNVFQKISKFLQSRRLLNAGMVVFDRLVFTRCLLPIYVEEVNTVMIKNCEFR